MERHRRIFAILLLAIPIAAFVAWELGTRPIDPLTLVQTLTGDGDDVRRTVLLSFRLPRILLALLVGAGFSVSGVFLQGILRNDLAAPGVLGVSAGGNLGVTLTLLIGGANLASPWLMPGMSIAGGMGALLAVYLLAAGREVTSPTRLLLSGVAVSAALGSLTLILSLHIDRQVYAYAVAWMSGSLGKADWNYVLVLAAWLSVCIPAAWIVAPVLDVLRLGDGAAVSLGLAVRPWRTGLLVLAVVLGAVSMSVSGGVLFLGLIGPHVARRLVGPGHTALTPAAALTGALLLLIADTVGRTMVAPQEIPAGVLVGAIGGVYFLYLLATSKG